MKKLKTILIVLATLAVIAVSGFATSTFTSNARVEANGGVAVNIQDQTSPPFDLYFIQAIGAPTIIASAVSIGDTDISIIASISAGTYVGIFCPEEGRFFFADVLAVAGAGPYTITVDTPADFAFEVGDSVLPTTRDMNVVGSLGTPSVFEVQGPGSGDLEIDVTRIIFTMTCTSLPDDGLFGNITALTNGIVIRRKDGTYRNFANVKSNGDFANLAYDISYSTRSVPAGSYGVRCRYTFAGQDKHGVAIRLGTDEALQILIQDDLTTGADILSFRAIVAGHVVTD
jgi:hypothetical protein